MKTPVLVSSRDNPLVQRLLKLRARPVAYRSLGQAWIEGEHLCMALLQRGKPVAQAVISQQAWESRLDWRQRLSTLGPVTLVPQELFNAFSALESPAFVGFLIDVDAMSGPVPDAQAPTVVMDRLQDPGNVGSILRSASALGFNRVIAMQETAALWSSKVLRAAMGAHFALSLTEGRQPADILNLGLPVVVASSHAGPRLGEVRLPWPCAWVLGHEGQGVCDVLQQHAALRVRIPQPGGEESLNVAAAAAICLYESMRQADPGTTLPSSVGQAIGPDVAQDRGGDFLDGLVG